MVESLRLGLVLVFVVAAACGQAPGSNNGDDDAPMPDASGGGGGTDSGGGGTDSGGGTTGTAPGGMCSCDTDCADDGANLGVCIYGVCMTKATAACASGGSQGECATGSRCWTLDGSAVGPLCWPDCSAHTCSGTCDADGSCAPAAQSNCDLTCGSACSCTTDAQCGTGMQCVQGDCVPETMTGGGPGPGPGPTCSGLPARDCTGTTCGTLVNFSPRTNAAWDDYPINGETTTNQYRSFLRKDLMMLVSYATSVVACKTQGWTSGNGGALGLGDMSEANGAIPGTSVGSPGHPAGTHTNGFDIDLAYYQVGQTNNRLRPICPYTSGGVDQSHCVGDPTILDVWRHALFLGTVFESSRTRVVGVDGKAGPLIVAAIDQLCDDGWLSATACNNIALAYETTNMGNGWYYHHHHHSHISLEPASFLSTGLCLGDCGNTGKSLPGRDLRIHRVRPQ